MPKSKIDAQVKPYIPGVIVSAKAKTTKKYGQSVSGRICFYYNADEKCVTHALNEDGSCWFTRVLFDEYLGKDQAKRLVAEINRKGDVGAKLIVKLWNDHARQFRERKS